MNDNARSCARALSVFALLLTLGLAPTGSVMAQDARSAPESPASPGAPDQAPIDETPEGDETPAAPDAPSETPAGDDDAAEGDSEAAPEVEADPEPVSTPTVSPQIDSRTGIEGVVLDATTSQPLAGAPVLITGPRGPSSETQTTMTDEAGRFRLPVVPGRYVVVSYYDFYHGAQIQARVMRGRFKEVRLVLDPLDEEEDVAVDAVEVTYRADASGEAGTQALVANADDQRDAASSDGMSAAGAGDAAAGAALVPGVLVEDGRPIIRGLSGQYVQVLMNGTPLPSTDPNNPGVDLDLFPTSVMQSLAVVKTSLPPMTAGWAGGVVDINTVQFPTEFTLQIGTSLGIDTQTSFQPVLDYEGGRWDWTGFDRSRELPGDFTRARLRPSRGGLSQAEVNEESRALGDSWQYEQSRARPNFGVSLAVGDSFQLSETRRIGYLLSLGYDSDTEREVGTNNRQPVIEPDGSLADFNRLDVDRTEERVAVNLFGTTSIDFNADHTLSLLGFFNRSTEDEIERQSGVRGELGAGEPSDSWLLAYEARTLFFTQLRGDHRNLGDTELRLRWSLYGGLGRRTEPDRRSVVYGNVGGTYRWRESAGSGERFFSALSQRDGGGEVSLQVPLWATSAGEARGLIGGSVSRSARSLTNRRFRYLQNPSVTDSTVYQQPIENLLDDEGVGQYTRFLEFSNPNDSYASDQTLYAAFMQLQAPLTTWLTFTGGARLEVFDQSVQSESSFDLPPEQPQPEIEGTDRTEFNVLPAATLRFAASDDMNVRLSYGMTAIRPQIRQLAPYQFYDFQQNRNISGNANIESTQSHNVDARWEWFFSETERITVSLFYKNMTNYIYLQMLDANTFAASYENTLDGYVVGAEFDWGVNLGRIHEALQPLSLVGNFTLADSRVRLDQSRGEVLPPNSPVPGQAPFVVNVSLRVDVPDSGFNASLVYNVVGPRVIELGYRAGDSLYPNRRRMPFHQLDLIMSWVPPQNEHLKFRLKFQNMLFQTQRWQRGDYVEEQTIPGATISFGFDYSY